MSDRRIKIATCGMAMLDTVCAGLEREPGPGELEWPDLGITDNPAGHPIDVALCLAALGYNPAYISIVASVGQDFAGDSIVQALEGSGLGTDYVCRSERNTGRNVVTVVYGEDRSFRPWAGANEDLEPTFVRRALHEIRPDILSIRPGYSGMDHEVHQILSSLPPQCFVLLDLMKPRLKTEWEREKRLPAIRLALRHADALHCNEGEAMLIADTGDVDSAISYFIRQGVEFVFITSGEHGARVTTRDGLDIRQRGFKVKAIDPTGCGDAFCAGIINRLAERMSSSPGIDDLISDTAWLQATLYYAQACGAAVAEAPGTTAGISAERVSELEKEQGPSILPYTEMNTLVFE